MFYFVIGIRLIKLFKMKDKEFVMQKMSIEQKSIDTIRCLSMDAVQKADSGHPGTPMALAPAAFALWKYHLKFNPKNPLWFNRDRFILSNGHASMLQYSILHLTGYDISIEDIKNFRQLDSKTPGHPEHGLTPGIETTTGPLGQGLMTAVGMAMAEAHLANKFKDAKIVDHHTYVFCSDGDFMEGASHEAGSIAGHLGLGKLIVLYDNNYITIEGHTDLAYSDDVAKRFEAYHWQVQILNGDGNDIETISKAYQVAINEHDKPSLIILRTHIGYGAPNKQDTSAAHGSPLGEEEIKKTKQFYGWPEDELFFVPDDVKKYMAEAIEKGQNLEQDWIKKVNSFQTKLPELYQQFQNQINLSFPQDWKSKLPVYKESDGPKATREINRDVVNNLSPILPWLFGGSADLDPSTLTNNKSSGYFEKSNYGNRNIAWGIREHVMCAASSGIMLHGGLRPYAATFFIFTDYARPAIRIAAIMKVPVIYVMTHDSIGLGEDGTTHQPIEHLASFRAMPNIQVIRPADANETAYAWQYALERMDGPTMLVLTRQKLPILDRSKYAAADGLLKGAYVLSPEKGGKCDVILIATGSEVELILEAQEALSKLNVAARVVSMPCWEVFRNQSAGYKESVLPKEMKKRIAVEAASTFGWSEWVGDEGAVIGMTTFGESAPAKDLFIHFGFTVKHIVEKTKEILK